MTDAVSSNEEMLWLLNIGHPTPFIRHLQLAQLSILLHDQLSIKIPVEPKELHPFMNAGLHFAESAIGILIAVLLAFADHYLNKAMLKKPA